MRDMKKIVLAELAFACHVYAGMSGYDASYRTFLTGTKPLLDLQLEHHVKLLLKWLNDWGCRQFAKDDHALAGHEIAHWHRGVADQLFPIEKQLLSLSDADFAVVENAYASLVHRLASKRMRVGRELLIAVGPTGAAKILFALRPNACIPWDDPMRGRFHLDGSAPSYTDYLRGVKEQLQALTAECTKHDFEIKNLPEVLGRRESSLPKLIDEFHWVTISRKCPAPSDAELRRWVAWL